VRLEIFRVIDSNSINIKTLFLAGFYNYPIILPTEREYEAPYSLNDCFTP